jgi:hypothetical protein
MWLLALEACVAFGLFTFIVWWTMFSGRKPEQPQKKTFASTLPADAPQNQINAPDSTPDN